MGSRNYDFEPPILTQVFGPSTVTAARVSSLTPEEFFRLNPSEDMDRFDAEMGRIVADNEIAQLEEQFNQSPEGEQ